jgi:phenylacetate-coenzyme A ligase PaaK-like adenylate-forming protein
MLVNTDVVVETVSAIPNIGQFQVVFMRQDEPGAMDRMVIRIEQGASHAAPSHAATFGGEIARRVREAVSLRPEIEFVARGELYDHERSIKAKRVLDLREADG